MTAMSDIQVSRYRDTDNEDLKELKMKIYTYQTL